MKPNPPPLSLRRSLTLRLFATIILPLTLLSVVIAVGSVFLAALDMLRREVGQNSGISIAFHKMGKERRLPPEVELALYRIAQEALNNVLRHSRASHAEVRLSFGEQTTELEVSDDGVGFDIPQSPTEFAPNGHFGLLGIYERADLISARLSVESAPGKGTRLRVQFMLY